jgi:hypothetical protein
MFTRSARYLNTIIVLTSIFVSVMASICYFIRRYPHFRSYVLMCPLYSSLDYFNGGPFQEIEWSPTLKFHCSIILSFSFAYIFNFVTKFFCELQTVNHVVRRFLVAMGPKSVSLSSSNPTTVPIQRHFNFYLNSVGDENMIVFLSACRLRICFLLLMYSVSTKSTRGFEKWCIM